MFFLDFKYLVILIVFKFFFRIDLKLNCNYIKIVLDRKLCILKKKNVYFYIMDKVCIGMN